jgi:hypothetical protein
MLATASIDGEVRLWRLPAPTLQEARAAGDEVPAGLHFDGQHLPDIAYNYVRVASATGARNGPWLALPQPVAFAQLVAGGKTLIAASGHELHVIDADAMQARRAPIDLPANPMRFGVTDDVAVLAFGTNSPGGFRERLVGYDLKTGARLGEATVAGPLRHFDLSPDGARLLTVGPASGSTEVFATATLNRIGAYPHSVARPVKSAAFVAGSDSLWLLVRDDEDVTANDVDLIVWNARTGAIEERRHLAGLSPVGITAIGTKPFLSTSNRDLLDPGTPQETSSPRLTRGEATAVFALSHDGRLLAHTFGWEVQVYDTATLAPVGPPLPSGMNSHAYPLQLAFSPDDHSLVGRHERWVLWLLPADARAVADLRRDAALLGPAAPGQNVLQVPSAAERALLRAGDPGPPVRAEKRPTATAARFIDGHPLPARDPKTSPFLLDLTEVYTASSVSLPDLATSEFVGEDFTAIASAGHGFASGVARIEGVDYDLRGEVALNRRSPFRVPAKGIRVPSMPIAAFHVLLYAMQPTEVPEVRDYAYLRVHYRDGSSARLPIRTQREVPGMTPHDAPTPVGWVRGTFLMLIGKSRQDLISNPRLPNPHPDKPIATIDLEAAEIGFSFSRPVFFAVTAEPVIAAADSGKDKAGNPNAAPKPSHPP